MEIQLLKGRISTLRILVPCTESIFEVTPSQHCGENFNRGRYKANI